MKTSPAARLATVLFLVIASQWITPPWITAPALAQERDPDRMSVLPLPETVLDDLSPLARGQLVRARLELEAAVRAGTDENPSEIGDLAAAFGHMGQTALAHRLSDLAEASLENARGLAPDETLWSYLAGVLYESQKRWQEAAAAYESVVAVDPSDAVARLRLARARASSGNRVAARAHFERCAEVAETAEAARYDLARLEGTPTDEAPPAFPDPRLAVVVALRSQPAAAPATREDSLDAIRALMASGETEQAVNEAQRAVADDPDDPEGRLLLGWALSSRGDRAAALAVYRKLLAMKPDRRSQGLAHLRIARLLDTAQPGQPPSEEAMEDYRKAVELTPNFANARLGLADALMRSDQLGGAIEQLRAMVEVAPQDGAAYTSLASALARASQHREALETLKAGHTRLPQDPVIANAYAKLLAGSPDPALRDGPAALAILLPLFQAQPAMAYAETIAAALATAGNFDDAVRWQEQLLARAETEGAKAGYLELQQRKLARYRAGLALP